MSSATKGLAGRTIPTDPDSMLLPVEAAHVLGLSHRTLESWRVRGGGPPFVRISARVVRYRRGSLLHWASEHQRQSTSAQ
jgi:hypothetical protein